METPPIFNTLDGSAPHWDEAELLQEVGRLTVECSILEVTVQLVMANLLRVDLEIARAALPNNVARMVHVITAALPQVGIEPELAAETQTWAVDAKAVYNDRSNLLHATWAPGAWWHPEGTWIQLTLTKKSSSPMVNRHLDDIRAVSRRARESYQVGNRIAGQIKSHQQGHR